MMTEHLDDDLIERLAESGEEGERELPDPVREHLAACRQCREEVALARRIVSGLEAIPRLEPPPVLLENVMSEVRRRQARSEVWTLLGALTAALFALVVVGVALPEQGAAGLIASTVRILQGGIAFGRAVFSLARAFPTELLAAGMVVLLASSLGLGSLMRRASDGRQRTAESG